MKHIFLFISILSLVSSPSWGKDILVNAIGISHKSQEAAIEAAERLAAEKAGVDVWVEDESIIQTSTIRGRHSRKSHFKSKTNAISQAKMRIVRAEITYEEGLYKANIDAIVTYISNQSNILDVTIKKYYPINYGFYFQILFRKPTYLTIIWFDDNSKECGFLEKSMYCYFPDDYIRFPREGNVYRENLEKMLNGTKWIAKTNSRGDVTYTRGYSIEDLPKPGFNQTKANSWVAVERSYKEPKVKNLTLLFITTDKDYPFSPGEPYFTRKDVDDWYFELPLEQKKRIIEKKIQIEI